MDQTDDDPVPMEDDLVRPNDDLFPTDKGLCQAFEVDCHASKDLSLTTQVLLLTSNDVFQATKVLVLTNQVLFQTKKVVDQTTHDVRRTNNDVCQATKVVLLERPRLRLESDDLCGLEEHRFPQPDDVRLYKQPLCLASQHVPLHRHGE